MYTQCTDSLGLPSGAKPPGGQRRELLADNLGGSWENGERRWGGEKWRGVGGE